MNEHIYYCWTPSTGQKEFDADRVRALSPEGAATQYARRRDDRQGHWPATSTVHVRRADQVRVQIFQVNYQPVPEYRAQGVGGIDVVKMGRRPESN